MRTDPIAEAVTFAEEAHRDQTRKGTDVPYLAHLLGVASIVLEHGGDQDQAVAAVLHDTVEDTDVTVDAVRARFGARVAAIVDACTDTLEDSDRDRDGTAGEWLERKRAYVDHLGESPEAAVLVSAADKLHNATAIVRDLERDGPSSLARFSGKRLGTVWYYGALVEALGARLDELADPRQRQLGDELRAIVARLAQASGLGEIPGEVTTDAITDDADAMAG